MKISIKKNIVALVAFVAIQVMFLLYRFSVAGIITTAALILILSLRRFSKKYENNVEISPYLGEYVSAGLFNISLTEVCYFLNKDFFDNFNKFSNTKYWSTLIWAVVSYALLIIFYLFLKKQTTAYRVFKHAGLFSLNLLFLSLIFHNDYFELNNIIFCACIGVVFYIIDLFSNRIYNAESNSISIFASLTSAALMICGCIHPKYMRVFIVENVLDSTHSQSWHWYTIAVIGAVFIAATVFVFVFDNNEYFDEKHKDFTFTDSANILIIGFNIIAYALTVNHFTAYNYVFYLLLLVINIVVLLVPSGKKKSDHLGEKIFNNKLIIQLILFTSWIVLFISHINGAIDIAFIALLLVAINLIFVISKWISTLSVLVMGLLTLDIAYHWHSSPKIYALIIVFSIIMAVFTYLLSFNNKAFEEKDMGVAMQYLIVILASVVLLFAFSNTGVKISAKVDNEMAKVDKTVSQSIKETKNITVNLKAKGKDNSIVNCTYYWASDKKNVVSPKLNENSSFTIKNNGADLLVVVTTDKDGVITTFRHFYDIR